MKKTLLFTLALAAICILPSCKKDPSQGKVVFGKIQWMYVKSYKDVPLVEQYGHNSWGYFVDFNNDGHNDVQFHSTSELGGKGILTELYCCDENTALLGEIIDQKFTLLANNANDSFDYNSTFMSTNVTLFRYGINYFPMNEVKYIGFKLTKDENTGLGWMKVILHEDYVELLETAVQD